MGWLYVILYLVGWPIGVYGMFKKAGVAPWKAFIPFYNTWIICELCGISKVWFWLQLIPFAGQFITIWITIIFVMQFGRFSLIDHALTAIVPFIFLPFVGFSDKVRYIGPDAVKLYRKSTAREWIDALVFATVAATLIRTFIFEAYVIPTGSMEKTLLINDFLFVNKMTYGARIPETPLSFPFVHNFMPFSTTTPSYSKAVHWPYKRLPAFSDVKRNDVVVFNFPAGDTIINEPNYGSALPYYQVLRDYYHGDRAKLLAEHQIIVHPMDKTDNYIKRCTAVAGDTLQIINTELYINGKKAYVPPTSQMEYLVTTNGNSFSDQYLQDELHVKLNPVNESDEPEKKQIAPNVYQFDVTADVIEKIKKLPNVVKVEYDLQDYKGLFPYFDKKDSSWTPDNYGPLWVPKKGVTVTLTPQNIDIYRRIIHTYEHHTLEEQGDSFIIDGKKTNQYTFEYNYYWMMGDNRHRSQDSRYWGFVPETAVVGKASLIWFSWQNGPRWKRIFKSIH
ncbi:signal peptidase I [Arachidicoccus rhizosphaerae]|uniref:Signal peptidase I n=1 Tax=Arachidicoccus rhizosphaerae TaxID=551991 RepID=A0A1H4AUK8_9BACT|nr:signal peptidase I [Arachidicoccus rhizosphaerae]SEA39521.1 signal peptidase I [Arachidicoccus rhizosphaerae]